MHLDDEQMHLDDWQMHVDDQTYLVEQIHRDNNIRFKCIPFTTFSLLSQLGGWVGVLVENKVMSAF